MRPRFRWRICLNQQPGARQQKAEYAETNESLNYSLFFQIRYAITLDS